MNKFFIHFIINFSKFAPKKASFFKAPFDKNFKRERFNSEGNNKVEKTTGLYRNSKNFGSNPNLLSERNYSSEIEIDISKIKYSLTSEFLLFNFFLE